MSKRLLVVTHYYATHGGGVENVAAVLGKLLATTFGWTVTWCASDVDQPPRDGAASMRPSPMRAWNGLERSVGIPWPIWSCAAVRKLWIAVGQSDVVHLHDALYFGNAMAWLFARMHGVPVLVTQHVGTIPYRSRVVRAVHALANRTLGRLVLSTAEQVVFISPAVRDEFARFCHFRSAPAYLPNGVDSGVFHPQGPVADDPAIAAARWGGGRVFLFVGRFVEKKGLLVLRELATALADDLWIFAGHGKHDPTGWGLANVLVVRDKSGEGLAPYYRAADMLVLPSFGEGFPLVVQEAMACGTPAMVGEETAAGCPDVRPLLMVETVGAGDTALRWAHRLAELRGQPERLRGMRGEVSKFAHERWSWESTAATYAKLIRSLCARREK